MYKLCTTFAVLVSLAGCAGQPEPRALPAGAGYDRTPTATADVEPVVAVDIREFDGETVCENVKRPGSRIVVEQRCYTPDQNPAVEEAQQQIVRLQVEALRREQENLERMEREREIERQRAIMQRTIRQ